MKMHKFLSIILLMMAFIAKAQDPASQGTVIKGLVVSDQNEPVPGASVIESGTTNGIATDMNGHFSLKVARLPVTLVVRNVGFDDQTITVSSPTTNLRVVLTAASKQLKDIVVIGYSAQKKANLLGAVSSIETKELSKMAVTGVGAMLQGRAAGVQVTSASGDPRSTGTVVIRGVGNIRGMSPLYVIDGVPAIGNTGFNINPRDIENIQVLRDASSAAIYGARAAGGVILITTKKGSRKERTNVDISLTQGFSQGTFLPKLLGTPEYKKAWAAITPAASGWDESVNTDWVDYLYRTGKEQNYNASVSGGSEKQNYYISAGYRRVDGIVINSWSERYSLRVNSDYDLGKRVKVGERLNLYSYSDNPPVITGNALNAYALPFRSSPLMRPKNPDGSWGGLPAAGNYNGGNWAAYVNTTDRRYNALETEGNIYIDVEPVNDLHIRATGGADLTNSMARQFEAKWYVSGQSNQPQDNLRKQSNLSMAYVGNLVASYSKKLGDHEIKALVGTEARKSSSDDLSGSIYAVSSAYSVPAIPDAFPVGFSESSALSNVPGNTSGRSSDMNYGSSRMLSYFGKVNYTYKNKYLFEANLRQDISDRFAPSYRTGNFPSAAAGWRITEEPWLKDKFKALSDLKLRTTYGSLGNDGVGSYVYIPSLANYDKTQFNELPGTGAVSGWGIGRVANQNIHWETVTTFNVGADIGLFNNKLNATLDYYIRDTKDMLYQRSLPPSAGMTNGHNASDSYILDMNLGKMRNTGFEFAVNYKENFGKLGVEVGFNAAFNRNRILSFGGEKLPIDAGSAGEYWSGIVARTQLNAPISQFYGFKTKGLIPDQKTMDELNANAQSKGAAYWYAAGSGPGDIWYEDLNGDGVINDQDRTIIGNPLPKMTYGFNIGLSYQNFDLAAFFNGVYGNDIYNGMDGYYQSIYNDFNTTAQVFNSSFMYGNGLTNQPRFGYYANNSFQYDPNGNYKRISDYHIQKGSFLRLQNLQIGYNLPEKVLNRLKVRHLRVYYSGQNLFVITKAKNVDPEVGFSGANSSALAQGIISAEVYPKTRIHSFGLEFGF
ncbi:TonB-linked outer membrane protein, SusC/RagA family [Chitinophaga terrae (ex Kim and Jung 2007)]|uniref:TonB-linked outer membrane protein, SusC/RagA family n=1 Tax=Chitinophaga terrae (ex Kim and Jung 2007) TaxID=408074 RepID=A0A1H4EJA1_9BACT|nr:TonB-dependent receptor [Chitinophaga terrae (ex Kim and Jung 2007)]GEP91676.1 SusC/RagA family TonB-linked outer membrane protein [Chitinophaga terrae (ex Kim and Jung 2007)]SEA84758.1 TonB-linked outer membrane protein, SusC/RagA family [Chitinophaga terrae (ex Kim and Jung 2007)]